MRTTIKAILIFTFAIYLTGCIPKVHVLSPGITGTIIDAETKKPIIATVLDQQTNEQGNFAVPAKKELGLTFPFVGGHYLIETPFIISASGYQNRSCFCSVVAPTPACGKVVIPLQKIAAAKPLENKSRGQTFIINLDTTQSLEGGITCDPLWGETTITELEDAAQNGSVSALYLLGTYYLQGINVEKNPELGRYYMRLAAEAGNGYAINYFFAAARQDDTEAEILVGDLLSLGLGVDQNIDEAISWYKIAAGNGDTVGMLRLAEIYEAGEVVPTDNEKSLYWYHQATTAGSADAMYQLGEKYRYGLVVASDQKMATHWYVNAAEAGSEKATAFLHEIIAAPNLTAAEKQEAREWLSKHK